MSLFRFTQLFDMQLFMWLPATSTLETSLCLPKRPFSRQNCWHACKDSKKHKDITWGPLKTQVPQTPDLLNGDVRIKQKSCGWEQRNCLFFAISSSRWRQNEIPKWWIPITIRTYTNSRATWQWEQNQSFWFLKIFPLQVAHHSVQAISSSKRWWRKTKSQRKEVEKYERLIKYLEKHWQWLCWRKRMQHKSKIHCLFCKVLRKHFEIEAKQLLPNHSGELPFPNIIVGWDIYPHLSKECWVQLWCVYFEGIFLVLELFSKRNWKALTTAAVSLLKLGQMCLQLAPNCVLWFSILFAWYFLWKIEVVEVGFFLFFFSRKTSGS